MGGVRAVAALAALAALSTGAALGEAAAKPDAAAGEALFQTRCKFCHEPAIGLAATREKLAEMEPEFIVDSLINGKMRVMVPGLSAEDAANVATFLTGKEPKAAS
jgi:mono/diheme cytochrome c family protein